jgi:Rrf2 family protein
MSGGVEWALHCCVVLTSVHEPAPAARLAQLHDVSPSYLAKQLQALSRAGLVRSVQGKAGGYILTRSPELITVLDIVEAVDGSQPAFRCTEIRRRGPSAVAPSEYRLPCGIHRAMVRADQAWRDELRRTTIADLLVGVVAEAPPDALAKGVRWLEEVGGSGRE